MFLHSLCVSVSLAADPHGGKKQEEIAGWKNKRQDETPRQRQTSN